jgi:acetyltransferase-like isoleucine patch superfamily enzyme
MASRFVELVKTDFRGLLFHSLRKLFINVRLVLSLIIVILISLLKNIKIGSGNRFYGIPIFQRFPQSKIIIGKDCTFRSDTTNLIGKNKKCILVTTSNSAILEIGNNTGLNGSVVHCADNIHIGNDVLIGFNVLIDDSDHHAIDPIVRHYGKAATKPITIEDNVWLGANVTILKGTRIGKNSVIGANSLVLSDIPPNTLALGNPCRVIMNI